MSCFAKPFVSMHNKRLLCWSQNKDIIYDAQFGFKPGSGTRDAIFALRIHSKINDTLNACEIWGFSKSKEIERIHLKFLIKYLECENNHF